VDLAREPAALLLHAGAARVGEQLVVQRGVLGQRRLQLGVEPLQLVVAPLGAERDPGHQACDAAVDEHQRAEDQALRQSVRWEAARLRSGLRHGDGGHPDGRPRRRRLAWAST
jgi:hypothetical protein